MQDSKTDVLRRPGKWEGVACVSVQVPGAVLAPAFAGLAQGEGRAAHARAKESSRLPCFSDSELSLRKNL